MARHKMKRGTCRLCGEKASLSFEHVPPRVAYNKHTRYVNIPMDSYLQMDDPLSDDIKGKIMQGGIGYNSLCKKCNSFLGSNYVDAYKKWVDGGFELLSRGKGTAHLFQMADQEPLRVIKQIISMFLSINRTWFGESFPELIRFVEDPQESNLPEKFRVLAYLNIEGKSRYLGYSVLHDASLGGIVICSEISYPPYGYVLTIDYNYKIPALTDITHFKNYGLGEVVPLILLMFKLPTHLPISLDYRSKAEIEKTIAESKVTSKEK